MRKHVWQGSILALAAALGLAPFLPSALRPGALVLIALASVALVWSETARPTLPRFLPTWLGSISYTLYATHMPMAVLVTSALASPLMHVSGSGRWGVVLAGTVALVAAAAKVEAKKFGCRSSRPRNSMASIFARLLLKLPR